MSLGHSSAFSKGGNGQAYAVPRVRIDHGRMSAKSRSALIRNSIREATPAPYRKQFGACAGAPLSPSWALNSAIPSRDQSAIAVDFLAPLVAFLRFDRK